MGQSDRSLRVRLVEPDARTPLANVQIAGIQISVLPQEGLAPPYEALRGVDAIAIAVDTPRGLDLVADVSAWPGMPGIIAVGGQGHDGKSLEHVLLLAELRGAAATLVKPFTPQELVAVAFSVCNLRPYRRASGQSGSPDRPAPLAGRIGRSGWPAA